jgi:hypothetical protein
MANKERIREPLSGLPTLEHLVERVEAGWKLVALEWEREAAGAPAAPFSFFGAFAGAPSPAAVLAGFSATPSGFSFFGAGFFFSSAIEVIAN